MGWFFGPEEWFNILRYIIGQASSREGDLDKIAVKQCCIVWNKLSVSPLCACFLHTWCVPAMHTFQAGSSG